MQKHLADNLVQRDLLRLKFNRLQVQHARQNVVAAEFDVGRVRLAIRKSGHYASLAQSSDSEVEAPEGEFTFQQVSFLLLLMRQLYGS